MNKKEVKKAPILRFKGFTNDWEQQSLKKIFTTITDYVANGSFASLRHNVKTYKNPNYAYLIRLMDASNNWNGPWLFTDKKGYDFLSKSSLKPKDILLSNVGAGVGKTFQVPKLDKPMTLAPNAVLLRSNKLNNQFCFYLLKYPQNKNKVLSLVGVSAQPKLNKTDFGRLIFNIPSDRSEQDKISKILSKLDKIVNLQQRKLESFQFTYHEIIRRLFLKKAKWQQTKLSDLVTILDKNRKPVKKEDRLFGDTPYYGANGIQDYISGFTHKGEFILIAEDGANSLTEYPIYFVKGQIWVNNHAHVLKINKDVSPLFLALALKQINYSKYTVGSSRNKLNLKDLENIAIFIPDNNEQQRIGQFYSNYLNYLRINKKRIQYMKQFKQFLLQNMFI